jgi:hypothetical protein
MKFKFLFMPETIHLRINRKKEKNEKNWIEPIELELLYWIFYSSI